VINAISVDLEDWFCVRNLSGAIGAEDWGRCELRIAESARRLLEILDRHGTKATFFVLGWVAERAPELIREICREGHEIATHGHSHTPVTDMTPEAFEEDLKRSLGAIGGLVRQDILGYRAPSFSIVGETLWAVDILARNGIRYDSSIFPVSFHPDYGYEGVPLGPHSMRGLVEFPLSVVRAGGKSIPCSGGGYFRLMPYGIFKRLVGRVNSEGRPHVFYIHPWELDPGQPRVPLPVLKRFRHYCNLENTEGKLERLLGDFEFAPMKEVLGL
jgi:polysaccharide deacetylase family protein (PEP-CTERM system associated)